MLKSNKTNKKMKASVLKWFYVASLLFFIDWIIMVITGCFAGMCNASNEFFCGTYCLIGIVFLSISFLLVLFLLLRNKSTAS